MIHFIIENAGVLFISMEVVSLLCLLFFGLTRYLLDRWNLSMLFILFFIGITALEAGLAWLLFSRTGEISTLQIIITIFVLYAITFGIQDFKKLDRWMKQKIGKRRGIDLLTEKDRVAIQKQNDPARVARNYRYSSIAHILVFITAQVVFFSLGTDSSEEAFTYLRDWSWLGSETGHPSETLTQTKPYMDLNDMGDYFSH
ncbi:hypothetical protein [Bacillus sp. JCM 19041]|uniref:hypothetical protein n=1 Tax=Bacillus sp. JCM 19041 TaxID=1460637 RepID=UPI000AC984A7